jgi:hypothetical protein
MKKIITLFVFSFFLWSCTSLKFLDVFDGNNGRPQKTETLVFEVKYINNEVVIEKKYTIIFIYDKRGRRLVIHTSKPGEDIGLKGMYYDFDKYGNEIRIEIKTNKGLTHILNKYKYNKYGQQIKREYFAFRGDTLSRKVITSHKYFRKGRTDSIIAKMSSKEDAEYMIKKYDEQWREIEYSFLYQSGKLRKKHTYEYDSNGNNILTRYYNSSNKLIKLTYNKFNEKNDLISNLIFKVHNSDTIKTKGQTYYEYKYDSKDNISKKKWFVNDKLKYIEEVKYTY